MVETELMASIDQLNDGGYIFEKLGVRPMRPLTLTVARDLVLLTFMMGARESTLTILIDVPLQITVPAGTFVKINYRTASNCRTGRIFFSSTK